MLKVAVANIRIVQKGKLETRGPHKTMNELLKLAVDEKGTESLKTRDRT